MSRKDTTKPLGGRRPALTTARAVAATAAIALGVTACSGGPSSTNAVGNDADGEAPSSIQATLAFALSSGFDPDNASSAVATAANQHIFEALVDLDSSTREPYLALAADWPVVSNDGLTQTVTIREGAKFSNGEPVTAEDVAHSFNRILTPPDPEAPPLMQGFISFIEKVEATDDKTVEFTLKNPFPIFNERLAVVKIVPKALTGNEAESKKFDSAPVGSGPYKLDSASKESGLKLSRNEHYNGPRPATVDTMSWNTTTEASARISDLKGGRVQAIEAVPYLNVDSLKSDFEVEAKSSFNHLFLMFNTAAEPFDDKRVRQALHYAINKEKVIQTALSGYGSPATSYFNEGNANYQKASTVYDYDPKKAKQLLKEAGVDNLSFELTTTDASFVADSAPLLVEAWEAIGVKATVNTVPSSAVYGEIVPSDEFRVLAASGDPSVFGPDADLLLRWFYYGEGWPVNRFRWNEADRTKMANLLDKAAQTTDEAERKDLWKQAIDFAAEEAALYPVFHTEVVTAYDGDKLEGFSGAPTTGLYFLNAERVG